MGQLKIREEASTPSTPSEGVILYPTVATPSILKLLDDAGALTTFALLEKAQTWTATQTGQPTATNVNAFTANMPSGTSSYAFEAKYNGTSRGYWITTSALNQIVLLAFDNGTGIGPNISLQPNTNGSTPAAASITLMNRAATAYNIWPDASGNLRIGTTSPTNANDGTGTVVGAQTSMAEAKNISDVLPNPLESLRHVIAAAKTLRSFKYKSGAYNDEEFPCGVVTDLAPRYGMDRDSDHPSGKSLNLPVAIGDLIAAVGLIAEYLGLGGENNG